MALVGYKKRSLMTAMASVVYMFPRYTSMVMAAGETPGKIGRRYSSYHTRRPSIPSAIERISSTAPLSEILRILVRRLNEPVPLRATTAAATAPSDQEPTTTVVEEKLRMAELADELVARYASLPPLRNFGMPKNNKADNSEDDFCERGEILEFLATECCPREDDVQNAVEDYSANNYERLRRVTTPLYEGFTDFVLQQNAVAGMGFLVSLREDLLSSLRYQNQQQLEAEEKDRQQRFRDLDVHLKSLFQRWFAPGLLSHERITYDSTPAKIIEFIATKEAVHPMKSLDDLKERLGESKRVFALFHPSLPNQPLVFVHVALLPSGLPPSSMEEIMATSKNNGRHKEQSPPEVAAFYSISNGVKGLAGVGLGEFLLKESIQALKEELSSLQTFVTLSPIPKFRKWIKVAFLKEQQKHQQRISKGVSEDQDSEQLSSLLSLKDREALYRCGLVSSASPFPWEEFLKTLEEIDITKRIEEAKTITDKDISNFLHNDDSEKKDTEPKQPAALQSRKHFFILRSVLLKLASSYLFLEKRRGKPLDKVCGFHVGNGAELHDLHFGADLSRGGLSNSYGLMANYLYDTERVSRNQANFESSGFVIPVGPGVGQWLEESDI